MNIRDLLRAMVEKKASDIHIKVGSPPMFRVNGELQPSTNIPKLDFDTVRKVVYYFLQTEERKKKFEDDKEMDLSHSEPGLARFRVNIFKARGSYGVVVRIVPVEIPSFNELNLPSVMKDIALEPRGLCLVTGTTGSGKSTTLAAMIDYINTHRKCHIVTIEDPIEFLHKDKLSSITQREIGIDTDNFSSALKHVLRQDPDVILIGELRDMETVGAGITAAETGHMVFGTLHTSDCLGTINRIIDFFPPYQQAQIRMQLSFTLKAVISMRLLARIDKAGRIPALEIMRVTANIRELIQQPERIEEINDAIKEGSQYGMESFDQNLLKLYANKIITYEEALS
ncbi:MAG: type IV pilus twitching motility protein PilT, partial [bacterium]|nr:type IV pilus twitching motility protein PilT [bacterium]